MTMHFRIGPLRQQLLDVEQKRDIIPDVLPVGVGFIYGPSTAGKTGLVVRTTVSLAAGLQWADRKLERGGVLYVAGEARRSVVQRISATIEYLGLPIDDLAISVCPCPPKGIIEHETKIHVQSIARQLSKETGLPISLIVFDTLSTCFGDAKEDDSAAASKAVGHMAALHEEFDCAVLGIHHPGKNGRGMRGSGVFFNNVDFVARVDRKDQTSVLTVEKMKDGAAGARFAFTIASHELAVAGGSIPVQVVKNINPWSDAKKATKEEGKAKRDMTDKAVALALLRDLAKNGPVSRIEWQVACYEHWSNKPTDASRKQAFNNSVRKLQADGAVIVNGEMVTESESESTKHAFRHAFDNGHVTESESESTTPSMRGVHFREDSRNEVPFQKPDGADRSDGTTTLEGTVGRTNVLPRGAGVEDPAERHGAPAFASTGTGR